MLLRTLVLTRPAQHRRRILRLLPKAGTVVVSSRVRGVIWNQLRDLDLDLDLLIVSRSLLSEDPASTVAEIRRLPDRPEVIVTVETEDPVVRASLLAAGSLAVLNLGVADAILEETLGTLVQRSWQGADQRIERSRAAQPPALTEFAAESPSMRGLLDQARLVVDSDATLLISGETGVGKERLARALHRDGPRSDGPFVALNCGAIPEGLLESELFGHERGAFTGAIRSHRGYFELAHRGTVLIDEVAELPFHLQVKLLRVLDDRRVQRVGGETAFDVDVRVIAATNLDLETEVREGRFRKDLYYRIAVVTLSIPPLRERREDIPILIEENLPRFRSAHRGRAESIAPEALEALCRYAWPGNVRELVNAVERMVLLSRGSRIEMEDLPHRILVPVGPDRDSEVDGPPRADIGQVLDPETLDRPWKEVRSERLSNLEALYLDRILRRYEGRIGLAAAAAGLTPRALYSMLRRHGLRKEPYRNRNR